MDSEERDGEMKDIDCEEEELKNALRELADLMLECYFQQDCDMDSIILHENTKRENIHDQESIVIWTYPYEAEEYILSLIELGKLGKNDLYCLRYNDEGFDDQEDWERHHYPSWQCK
jgi:hypothetical protein